MIETLEIMDRIKNQDSLLNNNLNKIYNKYETLVLIQNELFEKYISDRNHYQKYTKELNKKNQDIIDQMNDLSRVNKALEDTIK